MLQLHQKRRNSKLKEVTEQNLKMFFRIKAQKSDYRFEEMHKQFSSELKTSGKSRYDRSVESNTNQRVGNSLRARCESAKNLLRVSSSFKRSIAESKVSKISIMNAVMTEEAAAGSGAKIKFGKENKPNEGIANDAKKRILRIGSASKIKKDFVLPSRL